MFACEHYDVVPDILVAGKGLGGGIFPLAAMIVREDLNIAPAKALGHYTHEKNPVAAAAGLATLECLITERLIENSQLLGNYALNRLRQMMIKHPIISDVRGIGLLLGIELALTNIKKERALEAAERILYRALSRGLSFKLTMGNIITLTPPLNITQSELDIALDILEEEIAVAETDSLATSAI